MREKNEERLRNIQDNFKHYEFQIIRVLEGEDKEQDIETLFKQIMKENFTKMAK